MDSKFNKKIIFEGLVYLFALVYIGILLKVVMFKYISVSDVLAGKTFGMFRSANFIPFDTIIQSFTGQSGSVFRAFLNMLGNIVIFAPFGYCLGLIFKWFNRTWKVGLASFILSVTFEILQYTLYIGSLDIDDVILNTLGGVIGYGVYKLLANKIKSRDRLLKASIGLCLCVFVIGYGIAKNQFGDILGISNHRTVTTGQEAIPQSKPDIMGTYTGIKDNSIKLYTGRTYKGSSEEKLMDKASVKINNNTKIYFMEISEDKKVTNINYKLLTIEELGKVKEYSNINLWKSGDIANVIVLWENTMTNENSGGVMVSDPNTISGILNSVGNGAVNVNIVSTVDNGDGSSTATSGNGEYANNKDIKIKDGAKVILKTINKSGRVLDEKTISLNELVKDDSLEIKCNINGKDIIGIKVTAYRTISK
ncbi:MAG: VanZ family protein [Clostridium sp.]